MVVVEVVVVVVVVEVVVVGDVVEMFTKVSCMLILILNVMSNSVPSSSSTWQLRRKNINNIESLAVA